YDKWLDTALATWREMLAVADRYNVKVMFENTYETDPAVHKQLFEELDSPNLGFCLDTGHVMAFAGSTWQLWLDALAPWLGQLHLHDNDGKGDDHIAIGKGIFNFRELFDFLGSHEFQPLITLEPHSEEDLWQSLAAIDAMNLFRNVT
ncbi:MAG: TIM barrel protein, partial [Desulfobulbaceae bacterium]|nr:TIM barrel protein [Desulfobulbaceae bacterium]